jgi:hypothetical protein
MSIPQEYLDKMNNSKDPNLRFMLVHNDTKGDIYPEIQAYDFSGNFITDKTTDLPSGFKLAPGDFKLLSFPKQVNSGRIAARTGCVATDTNGLFCTTGYCPLPASDLPDSQGGLLCGKVGGKAPTTLIEFTFDQYNNEYYDISQVDGNNLSVSISPVTNTSKTVPSDIDPSFWCKNVSCAPSLSKDTCPPELRVYDNNNNFVACQSICSALGSLNYDGSGKYVGPGKLPNGYWADSSGPLSVNEPQALEFLKTMHDTRYYWDENATTPVFNDSRPETKKGRWVKGTCSDPNNCLTTESLVCCKSVPGNSCGDIGGGKTPSFTSGADQGCSPYVNTKDYSDPEYFKHICWSEIWPLSSTGKNYHELFKDQCKSAYSWAFDDLNSTYHCASDAGSPPVHYYVRYMEYGANPSPSPSPSPSSSLSSSPSPSPSPSHKKIPWKIIGFAAIGLFLLVLILLLVRRK